MNTNIALFALGYALYSSAKDFKLWAEIFSDMRPNGERAISAIAAVLMAAVFMAALATIAEVL